MSQINLFPDYNTYNVTPQEGPLKLNVPISSSFFSVGNPLPFQVPVQEGEWIIETKGSNPDSFNRGVSSLITSNYTIGCEFQITKEGNGKYIVGLAFKGSQNEVRMNHYWELRKNTQLVSGNGEPLIQEYTEIIDSGIHFYNTPFLWESFNSQVLPYRVKKDEWYALLIWSGRWSTFNINEIRQEENQLKESYAKVRGSLFTRNPNGPPGKSTLPVSRNQVYGMGITSIALGVPL